MPLSQCNETYSNYDEGRGISKSQYCAYSTEGSCRLLYGGALQIFPSGSSLPNIVGITSFEFGNNVCTEKRPGVLTRIAYYIPWIEENVWPFDRST